MSVSGHSIFKPFRILLVCLAISFNLPTYANTDFSQLIVFGDSLSDTGNLSSLSSGGFPLPYDRNRVTNGPVAVERLAELLQLPLTPSLHFFGAAQGSNYAVARARAISGNDLDLQTQLIAYMANNGFVADPEALYVLFIGGNDIRTALGIDDYQQATLHVKEAADQVINALQQLSLSGARHFLVVNAPDIGDIPETRLVSEGHQPFIARASQLSQTYRIALKNSLKILDDKLGVEIELFDLMKFFSKLTRQAADYGFVYTTEPCFNTMTGAFHDDCPYGMNADAFLYFDEIHPTQRLHRIIGQAFYDSLD